MVIDRTCPPVLAVKIQAIDYWEGNGKIVSLLKFAKSAITSTPSKLGEHGTIKTP